MRLLLLSRLQGPFAVECHQERVVCESSSFPVRQAPSSTPELGIIAHD